MPMGLDIREIEAVRGVLKQERTSHETFWRDIERFILPEMTQFEANERNDGKKTHGAIFNGTATYSLRILAAGLMSGLTSPSRPWFELDPEDPGLRRHRATRIWLEDVEERMRLILLRSNFYQMLPVAYTGLGGFGTHAVTQLEDEKTVTRFYPHSIGSYVASTNHRNEVDTFIRDREFTVRQLIERFGEDGVSDEVRDKWRGKNGGPEDAVEVIHAIFPNRAFSENSDGLRGKRYLSVYYEAGKRGGSTGDEENRFLQVRGFEEFPTSVPRWHASDEDVWGSGPGRDALGDVKSIQSYEKKSLKAVEKEVDPPLQAPASVRNQSISQLPGAINYYDDRNQNTISRLYDFKFDINGVELKIQQAEQRIKRAFYEDLFLMIANLDRREITAREIEERHEEKLLVLGPVLERLNAELLDPVVTRTFNIMARRGLLPLPPPELEGVDLNVRYTSILAQAQRMVGIASIDRFTGFIANVGGVAPEVLDKVDSDALVSEYHDALGVPERLLRPDEQVKQIRDARARAQAEQAQAEQAAAVAKATKDLSNSPVTGDSVLQRLVNRQ